MAEECEPIYSDGAQVTCLPFGVTLNFTVSPPPMRGNQPPVMVADIRMSPEHAKVLAIILRRQLKEFEQQIGRPIPLHPQMMAQLGLSPTEDW